MEEGRCSGADSWQCVVERGVREKCVPGLIFVYSRGKANKKKKERRKEERGRGGNKKKVDASPFSHIQGVH